MVKVDSKLRLGKRGWIGAACVGLAILVTLKLCGWYGWHNLSPRGRAALVAAREKSLTPIQIPFNNGGSLTARVERVRPQEPLSQTLLFWSDTNRVFEFDTVSKQLAQVSTTIWENASGEVCDYVQTSSASLNKPLNDAIGKRFTGTEEFQPTGRHIMKAIWSPSANHVALVSADGRFHSPVRGLMFGGRNSYADGQHYLEVCDSKTGILVMPAMAISSFRRESMEVWWTADERFLICYYSNNRLLVVPTGLPASSRLLIGAQAQAARFAVFQPDRFWENEMHPSCFHIRYEDPSNMVPLLRSDRVPAVYRYDPYARTLALADGTTWDHATGADYPPEVLFPTPPREPPNREEQIAADKAAWEHTPADLVYFHQWDPKVVNRGLGGSVGVAGKIAAASRPSPDKLRFATASHDGDDVPFFYHEVFDARNNKRIGDAIRIDKISANWYPGGSSPYPYLFCWTPDGRYIMYVNILHRYLCIVHTDLAPP